MNGLCSHERLELALSGLLNDDEESTLHLHLKDCVLCFAEMERLSGGEQASREIAAMLIPDDLDEALPLREECSTADFVVDHLEPSDDPAVLGRLGGYDVLDVIGRGGMGVVLKGFDRELKRFVAIKALAPHLAHSALARKRFAREAQAAAAVVNLHVIAIHQVQPNGQLPFLVMPLLTGESLAQRLKARGSLELKEILRIGMQAAEGLAAAHGQGLIHRDVKPANILLEKGVERAVLTDFGLARTADDVSMTRWGIIAGTPEYMSPEQARGEALDGRSDLFSLGCVLYEMATGVSPFRTDSTMATLRRIVDEQPAAMASLVPELPPWFSHIVERLLSKDPAQRFASASEVSQLLEQCLSHLQQPASVPLPASLVPHATGRRSIINFTRKGVFAMLGTIGLTLLGMVLFQATEAPDISGHWTSDEWGTVVLETKGPGQYEGTFGGTNTGKPATGKALPAGGGAEGATGLRGSDRRGSSFEILPGSSGTPEGSDKGQPAEGASGLPGSDRGISSSEILAWSPGASGIPAGSNKERSGTLHLKWSRVERRFNGTWGKGADRTGTISLRLDDKELRGGFTTDEEVQLETGTPLVGDLLWKRSVVKVPDGGTVLLGGPQRTSEAAKSATGLADMKERRDVLLQRVALLEKGHAAGETNLETVLAARDQLFQAQLELVTTKDERLAIYQKRLDNMCALEKVVKQLFDAKECSQDAMLSATAARLQAEIDLARAGVAEPNPPTALGESPPKATEATPKQDRRLTDENGNRWPATFSQSLIERLALQKGLPPFPANTKVQEFPDRFEVTAAPWRATQMLIDGALPSYAHNKAHQGQADHQTGDHSHDANHKDATALDHKQDHADDANHEHKLSQSQYLADEGKLIVPKDEKLEVVVTLIGHASFEAPYLTFSAQKISFHLGGENPRMILSGDARFNNNSSEKLSLSADTITLLPDKLLTNGAERILLEGHARIKRQRDSALPELISADRIEIDTATNTIKTQNARTVVEAYVSATLASDVAKAAALAKNAPADPKRIAEIPKQLNVNRLAMKSVYVNDPAKPVTALATSEAVKLTKKQPDGQRDGFLVLTLTMSEIGWFVTDIDFESEEGAEDELKRFREANPSAVDVPTSGVQHEDE